MTRESRSAVVGLLFVTSGSLGLIYQVAWFKYLSLFLGNTTHAQTIVLATFMGGLAIGASLWGRRADRSRRPLALYGWLELAIGAYCLAYPALQSLLRELFVSTVREAGWPSGSTTVLSLKLLISFATLLPPTILMGGTLPVLVRYLTRSLRDAGSNIAILYFLNSFGAVVGSLLAGFFFVRLIGLEATVVSAGAANVVVGIIALAVGRREHGHAEVPDRGPTSATTADDPQSAEAPVFTLGQARLAVVVAGTSGFCAMVYEVAWVRMLIPVLGSSTYSFTLMLVAFISGITAGSAIVARVISRSPRLVAWLAGTQAGVAGSMMLILPLYGLVPYVFWWTAHLLHRSETSYPIFLALQFGFGFILLVIPTIFMGMGLPVAARIASQRADKVGSTVGLVFSVNTIGTVLGTVAAGLVFFPAFGVQRTVEIAVLLNTMAAAAVLWWGGAFERRKGRILAAGALAIAVVGLSVSPSWSRATSLSGVFRYINKNVEPPSSYDEFVQRFSPLSVPFYREGSTATVGVIETPADGGVQKVLIINGKPDASSVTDLPTQVLLGQLPMVLHPQPASALVIGLGSGVTAGSLLRHPVERVDCVEISPEVVDASAEFVEASGRIMDDPRFHLTVDDALTMLQLTDRRYDVIVSEPSNPWIAGIGSLYTSEFFALCRERLADDGLMVQWFHLYEMDDEMFRLVLRTFQSAFPHVTIWSPLATDVILVGSNHVVGPNDVRLTSLWEDDAVRTDFRRIGIEHPGTIYSLQVMNSEQVRRYADEGPLNTEDLPRLEYGAPRAFFVNRGVKGVERFDQRLHREGSPLPLALRWRDNGFSDDELSDAARWHESPVRGAPALAYQFLAELHRRRPADADIIDRFAEVAARVGELDQSVRLLRRRVELSPRDPRALEALAWRLFDIGQRNATSFAVVASDESERLLRSAIDIVKDTVDRYRVRLADLMFAAGRYRHAMDQYARAIQLRETHRPDPYIAQDQLFARLAMCLYQVGDRARAAGYALQATQMNPKNEQARDLVFRLWTEGSVVSKSE